MNISEAAKMMGLTAATLRYYEREGLIPPVTRKNGGVRDYQQDDLGWIDFIKCMRSAGMSVESLIEYTTLFRNGEQSDEARKNILIREREQLIAKQKEISDTIEKLNGKIKSFEGNLRDSEESLTHLYENSI
jgi:DNA-binding transcriptional MerR regulator